MAAEGDEVINVAVALARLGGERQLLRDLAQICLEDAPPMMARIESAIERGDIATYRDEAHRLKSLVANLAAEPACRIAERIELAGRRSDHPLAVALWPRAKIELERLLTHLQREVCHPSGDLSGGKKG
jgi:two-component system, sensor histidine kinase and response regulator